MSTLASAIIGAAVLPAAHGAGLGKLTVLSALGQPLRAEIELTAVTPDEARDLTAKLAPAAAFSAASIDFNPALLNLRFDIDQRGERRFIRITSAQPINEPFVDMLLELTWASGRLVREYTFLLDPADLRNAQSPQVAAPVEVNRATAQAGAPAPQPATSAPAPQSPQQSQPRPAPAAPERAAPRQAASEARETEVTVRRGDTLSRIAAENKPAEVSLDMMLVALYRANPEAFAGKNMNRLKSGTILTIPDEGTIRGTGRGEARGVVVAHAADFNAYRNRLAGQVAASTPAKAAGPQQSAAGQIAAKVEERPNAVNAAQDQLKLSKAGEAAGKAGSTGAAEDKIAKDQQVADAAARVKELEKNVSDLENLVAVKNKSGADAQNRATPEMDVHGAAVPAAPQPVAPAAPATEAKPAATPAAKPAAKPAPVPAQLEPGIMDTVMDNIQAIAIGLAAVLAGVGLLVARRRKAREAFVVAPTSVVVPQPGEPGQVLIAEPGGQSVDTSNSVFNSNFAPSASQLDTNEVDPVAEADVYIAYGRDAQAEEILKEALRTHPERHAVRLKLLEIYANRKDLQAFEAQATELRGYTGGAGDEWAQAATLGRGIDPANPLYGDAPASSTAFGSAAVAGTAAAAATFAASDFASALDDASRAREAEARDGLDLDLGQEPVPPAGDEGAVARPEERTAAGDLDFDFGDATALPAASAASDTASAPADNLMDFDFGDDTAVPAPVAPASAPAPAPAPSVADAGDAEHFLDFDLGGLDAATPATVPPASPAPAADPFADKSADDLDLAFDLPGDAARPEEVTAAPAPADLAMDFDLDLPGDDQPATAPAPAADPLAELDLMDFDVAAPLPPAAAPSLEDDFALDALPELPDSPAGTASANGAGTSAPAASAPPPEFDLSGIDLELDELADQPPAATPPLVDEPAVPAPAAAPEQLTPLQMEMDTKLDLAVAYQEIGDKEGARELLDEVLRGGSDDQVSRANQMLASLG
ncbi:FimV/HubP family polar landmark protein [Pseudoduganella lurida]|uniref:FimV/HubP family polar landmark protein n=1 Tax=Pseudoduganella lurida TaxID=1036180 RepID=UPI0027D9578F|nr:FimV/HubP family polar landmark protein [Pseudoduganella lurida]